MQENQKNETMESTETEKDYKDLYLRLYADMENMKKRFQKEREDLKNRIKMESLSSIIEIDNDLHFASKSIEDDGIKIIVKKVSDYLKSQGIEEVQTDNYDEDIHEVISVVKSDNPGIFDVVSKGYSLNGKIIKYPKVILSK